MPARFLRQRSSPRKTSAKSWPLLRRPVDGIYGEADMFKRVEHSGDLYGGETLRCREHGLETTRVKQVGPLHHEKDFGPTRFEYTVASNGVEDFCAGAFPYVIVGDISDNPVLSIVDVHAVDGGKDLVSRSFADGVAAERQQEIESLSVPNLHLKSKRSYQHPCEEKPSSQPTKTNTPKNTFAVGAHLGRPVMIT